MVPQLQNNGVMGEVKTSRPFRERFLDGYDRSQLREEVQKVRPKRGSLRKKYATWALGGALALGALGIPLKMGSLLTTTSDTVKPQPPKPAPPKGQIAADLQTAKQIADQETAELFQAYETARIERVILYWQMRRVIEDEAERGW